jgi:hypothetical protein
VDDLIIPSVTGKSSENSTTTFYQLVTQVSQKLFNCLMKCTIKHIRIFYGMHAVVCRDITNGAVYITIISTNVNKDKSMLIYRHAFTVKRCSATCFDFKEVITRRTYKNSVLVLELYFNIEPCYYNVFYFYGKTLPYF